MLCLPLLYILQDGRSSDFQVVLLLVASFKYMYLGVTPLLIAKASLPRSKLLFAAQILSYALFLCHCLLRSTKVAPGLYSSLLSCQNYRLTTSSECMQAF